MCVRVCVSVCVCVCVCVYLRAQWVKGVKKHKVPVIKSTSPGDARHSMVTIVNNTVLHILKLLRE